MIERGGVDEELHDSAGAIEQSWAFAAKPTGVGDLVVRVRVDDVRLDSQSDDGLSFIQPSTKARVHYGAGTWVDARGTRTRIPVHFADGAIALSVPAEIVEEAAYPAVLDPTISPELEIGTAVSGPAPGQQAGPAVGWDGTNYLVAWYDDNTLPPRIAGARVSPAGLVADPAGFSISTFTPSSTTYTVATSPPNLAFDGTNYLATWVAQQPGKRVVLAMRVSKAGAPVDATEAVVGSCAAAGCTASPLVAFDGTNYLVTWVDGANGFAARVSPANAVLDATPIALPLQPNVGLACDGTNCLAASTNLAVHISKAGTVVDVTPVALPSKAGSATNLVWDGTQFTSTVGPPLTLSRIGSGGVPTGLPRDPAGLGWNGAAYHVLVTPDAGGSPLAPTLIGPDGGVFTAPQALAGVRVPGKEGFACSSTGCLYAWADHRDAPGDTSATDIYAARISAAGAVLDANGFLVSTSSDSARSAPSATASATQGLVVWQDDRGPRWDVAHHTGAIRASRISTSGTVLDPAGVELSGVLTDTTPVAASDGTGFLVVWAQELTASQQAGIFGRLFTDAGAAVGAAPFKISDTAAGAAPQVVFDGAAYGVFWTSTSGSDARFGRVSVAGTVLDTPSITVPRYPQTVAFNGTHYLLVWGDNTGGPTNLYGVRMTKTGTFVDAQPFGVSVGAGNRTEPSAAGNGTDWLVAWTDRRSAGSPSAIFGARVLGADGGVVDANGLALAQEGFGSSTSDSRPSIGWSPTRGRWVVTFTKQLASCVTAGCPANPPDIVAIEVDPSSPPGASTPVATAVAAVDGARIGVVGDKVLVTYRRFDAKAPYGAVRARARVLDLAGTADAGVDSGAQPDSGSTSSSSSSSGSSSGAPDGGSAGGSDDSSCGCRLAGVAANDRTRAFFGAAFGIALCLARRRRAFGAKEGT